MNVTEPHVALHEKMREELADFTNWLILQPPAVILEHAFEYATKTDIVSVIEDFRLYPEAAKAMLSQPDLLDSIWKEYGDSSSNSMDVLVSFITDKAEELASAVHSAANSPNIPAEKAEYARKSTLEKLKTPSVHGSAGKYQPGKEAKR